MLLPSLVPGHFVQRDNRFRVTVDVEGQKVAAHLPNSGRLTELLTPGRPCWLEAFDIPHRKTDFDLKLMEYAGVLVSVDARLPNPLFAEALESGRLSPFRGYTQLKKEVTFGESRLDFRLSMPAGSLWVEAKSVTLVEDGVARFPDAPTTRGARHARELAEAVRKDDRAAIAFIIQRPDAQRFSPHHEADPNFSAALRRAASKDVGVYAWACEVSREEIAISRQVPVDLSG